MDSRSGFQILTGENVKCVKWITNPAHEDMREYTAERYITRLELKIHLIINKCCVVKQIKLNTTCKWEIC